MITFLAILVNAPKHGTAPRLCGSEPHVLLLYDSGLIYLYKFGGAGGS